MDLSYAIPDPPSTDTVMELLCEADIAALKVEVEIEEVLKSELLPLPIRRSLDDTLGRARQWREDIWGRVQALEQAEFKAELMTDGVDPDDPAAVDKWFDDEQKKRDQQIATHQVSKRTGPEADEAGVKGDA